MKTTSITTIRGAVLFVLALAFLDASFSSARAQGTAFTYQGVLADGGGPANGVYDFQFRLFNAVSGGAQQAVTVSIADFAVTNGLFTVALDFNAAPFDGGDLWLQVALRPGASSGAYTNLVPRQKITATPYAILSANAGTAVSVSGSISAAQLTGTISSNNLGAGSITSTMLATGAVGSNQLASGAVTTTALAAGAVTADKVATATDWFPLTIANPTPNDGDFFGASVAALGSNRVLIGASSDNTGAADAGAAYLFGIDGKLLTTFANPTPEPNDRFGESLATIGDDRVLIGASLDNTGATYAGAAYLFRTNGTLLTTFTNPTPASADYFGKTVAAVGNDRVLISAYWDDTGANDAGVAYLFNTNGALLTTFSNPTPGIQDFFGSSLAALGSDRVLIGAPNDDAGAVDAGTAYLFNTNGTLLATFFNPTPASSESFGYSVAAVGTDRVLIGTPNENTGGADAGAAYLFSTNGTLLTTFTNPTPAANDSFGGSLTALGSDRVLITASFDDTSATDAGATYLFSTNGTLLATFTTPLPADNGGIFPVASFGSDGVLIGADSQDLGAYNAGTAYVFSRQTFATGLVAQAVAASSITSASLEDGAVTLSKLAPDVITWDRADNDDIYRATGRVGIGTSTPAEPLEVSGRIASTAGYRCRSGTFGSYSTHTFNFQWTGSALQAWIDNVNIGTVTVTSDRRLKEEIEPLSQDALRRVMALKPSTFKYKNVTDSLFSSDGETKEGFIADELQSVIPSAVNGANSAVAGNGQIQPQTVNVLPVVAVLTKAVQEQQAQIQTRDTEIAELKQRLEKLEQLLDHKLKSSEK